MSASHITPLEQLLIDAARQHDCLGEICDLIDYDPEVGRVPEHWRVKPMLLYVFRSIAAPEVPAQPSVPAPWREAVKAAREALEAISQWVETRPKTHPWDAWQKVGLALAQLDALEGGE